jgi:hypothetical protein
MTNKKMAILLLSSVAVIGISGFATYSVTKYITTGSSSENSTGNKSASASPSTKPLGGESFCPLNGKKYTTADQLEWEKRRPVAVMIENHPDSRPQSGLTSADVVYEAVAEGGITRFMGLFLCDKTPQIVGPVRSARTYYIDWLSEIDALYAHVGGANTEGPANALKQVRDYGIKDLDQMGAGLEGGYYRDENRIQNVALEHTMYLNLDKLREYASKKFEWGVETKGARWDSTFERWTFKDEREPIVSEASPAATIAYPFWERFTGFNVKWTYDSTKGEYLRELGGQRHIDMNNDQQVNSKTVIVMFQEESNANDGYPNNAHLLYKTTGTGDAYIFANGSATKGFWSKSGRTAKTKFLDANRNEIKLDRGRIWISVVPTFSKDKLTITN